LKETVGTLNNDLEKALRELEECKKDLQRAKDENTNLKATVNETDKSRDLIVRELSNMKDVESDKLR